MRWLTRRLEPENGASAVLVGILMVPLIGCLAIALDVGALYVERSQLQNGADAAALAIAHDCAEDGVCDNPSIIAANYTDANANDGAANVLTPTFPTVNTVVVTSSTRVAGTNANAISHPFAALLGITSSTVVASATAEWGAPQASAIVLPLALSYCEFNPALDGTLQTIRYDTNLECKGPEGHPIPGGFGWLDRPGGGCEAFIDLDNATVGSEPGNSYPGACDEIMATLEGQTVLVPIFDDAEDIGGEHGVYHVHAFAAFTVTGWKFSGGNSMPNVNIDPAAPPCTGNCRGIQGYFDRWVSLEDAAAELGGPDLGAYFVRLID